MKRHSGIRDAACRAAIPSLTARLRLCVIYASSTAAPPPSPSMVRHPFLQISSRTYATKI